MLFKKGFKVVNEEKERQEKNRENMQKGLWRFFLGGDGDEADIIFLTEEPINYYEHTMKVKKQGKDFFEGIPCNGSECTYCADGDRPSFKSAWLVVDRREFEYKDKDGKKKKGKDQIRLFIYGTRVSGQLDRYHNKYGLTGREYTMVRTGKDKQTSYMFERGDKVKLTSKEIEQLLPEALREEYDGTEESLYDIVENQIKRMLKDNEDMDEENDTGDDEEEDDLVDLDETEEDDDDEEEVKPKKSKLFKSKSKKSLKKGKHKNVENKVKPSVKSIIKKQR